MNEERELLSRALKYVGDSRNDDAEDLYDEIFDFLSTPSDDAEEPVKWNDITDKELIELHGEDQFGLFCDADEFIDISRTVIEKFKYQNAHPPKPAEPSRKPMTREEIIAGVTHDTSDDFHAGYWAGVRWAEKHHGISGEDQ